MKLVYALMAIFVAVTGVHSAGKPPTAKSVYIDFQIKLCLTTIDVSKYLVKNRDNLYAFAIYANQTIAGDKTNASVASLISKILGPLDKVQNQTIKAALVVLNQTVLNCTAVLNPFFSLVYNSAVLLDQSASFILTMNDQLQDSFKNLLTALTTSVTDTTLNSSKVADCEKVAFAAIDANIKNAYNSSDSCFQYYSEYVTHSFTSQVKRIFMESLQCASKALNNVTYCMKSNIISDAKGMDTTTNCTRDSFMTCLRWGQTDSLFYINTDYDVISSQTSGNDYYVQRVSFDCYNSVWDLVTSANGAIVSTFAACVNNPSAP